MWQRRQSISFICKHLKEIHSEGLGANHTVEEKHENMQKWNPVSVFLEIRSIFTQFQFWVELKGIGIMDFFFFLRNFSFGTCESKLVSGYPLVGRISFPSARKILEWISPYCLYLGKYLPNISQCASCFSDLEIQRLIKLKTSKWKGNFLSFLLIESLLISL